MRKVKFNGTIPLLLPTLGLEVKPGDTIEVPDDFFNTLFEDVPADPPVTPKGNETKDGKKGSDA